jgi:cytochrome c-type biogenesis protein CcmE
MPRLGRESPRLMTGKLLVALIACTTLAACDKGPAKSEAATQPATPTVKEQSFGAGVALKETTPIGTLLADPDAYKGKTVRVEGMVVDVCPKRGCWFELAGDEPGQKLRFKVTDGEMVFPLESKGLHAIAEGQVSVKELTLEESKQYAEYQAKEYGKDYEPASITEPMRIVRIDGTGAIFRGK